MYEKSLDCSGVDGATDRDGNSNIKNCEKSRIKKKFSVYFTTLVSYMQAHMLS